ncbi:MAG: cytochrome-c peroxidase [Chitinophagaceae bacterium]|nr:cytochrome-c peroxidase [Chitinophagaceae bacterium]
MFKASLTIALLTLTICLIAYGLGACRKNDNPNGLLLLDQQIPESFPDPLYRFSDNPLSQEGFELGRKLFYDGILSLDGNFPCASCHQQPAAFGTYQHDRSHGYNGSHTLRNAPVLFNLAWQSSFHWDGEFTSLFDEAAQPINGHIEMAESFAGVIDKLQSDPDYRERFRKVFRSEFIRPEFILKALAQFTGYMTSSDSRYDRYKKGLVIFTPQELNGYQLFQANCASCHPEPLFTDYSFRNIGLPVDNFLNDFGKMRISRNAGDSLKFKVPTLRNVYISSNYMHDGRFNTLAQCINHYRTGVQASSTLDPSLAGGIALTNTDATNLALFLRTLTDSAFLVDPRFNQP